MHAAHNPTTHKLAAYFRLLQEYGTFWCEEEETIGVKEVEEKEGSGGSFTALDRWRAAAVDSLAYCTKCQKKTIFVAEKCGGFQSCTDCGLVLD